MARKGGTRFVQNVTYLLTCLLRRALILAEQGLMMLSEGETYCFALDAKSLLVGHRGITKVVVVVVEQAVVVLVVSSKT